MICLGLINMRCIAPAYVVYHERVWNTWSSRYYAFRLSVRDNDNLKSHKYVCITTYQPDTKSNPNPNPNPNPTTKQHAIVNIELNIVTCPTYPDKFIRDNVVAPSVYQLRLSLSHCLRLFVEMSSCWVACKCCCSFCRYNFSNCTSKEEHNEGQRKLWIFYCFFLSFWSIKCDIWLGPKRSDDGHLDFFLKKLCFNAPVKCNTDSSEWLK